MIRTVKEPHYWHQLLLDPLPGIYGDVSSVEVLLDV